MYRPVACSIAVLMTVFLFAAGAAIAKGVMTEVTPQSIKSVPGLSVQTEAEPSGLVQVTIRRARTPNTHLSGVLSLADERGQVAVVAVQALEFTDATEYRFSLRRDQVRHSTFTLEERPVAPGKNQPIVSCGPAFRFPLEAHVPAAKP